MTTTTATLPTLRFRELRDSIRLWSDEMWPQSFMPIASETTAQFNQHGNCVKLRFRGEVVAWVGQGMCHEMLVLGNGATDVKALPILQALIRDYKLWENGFGVVPHNNSLLFLDSKLGAVELDHESTHYKRALGRVFYQQTSNLDVQKFPWRLEGDELPNRYDLTPYPDAQYVLNYMSVLDDKD